MKSTGILFPFLVTLFALRLSVTRDNLTELLLVYVCVDVLAKQATYIWNDIIDWQDDRLHPYKRQRALAQLDSPVPGVPILVVRAIAGAAFSIFLWMRYGLPWLPCLIVVIFVYQYIYDRFAKRTGPAKIVSVSLGYVERAGAGGLVAFQLKPHHDRIEGFLVALIVLSVVVYTVGLMSDYYGAEARYLRIWRLLRQALKQASARIRTRSSVAKLIASVARADGGHTFLAATPADVRFRKTAVRPAAEGDRATLKSEFSANATAARRHPSARGQWSRPAISTERWFADHGYAVSTGAYLGLFAVGVLLYATAALPGAASTWLEYLTGLAAALTAAGLCMANVNERNRGSWSAGSFVLLVALLLTHSRPIQWFAITAVTPLVVLSQTYRCTFEEVAWIAFRTELRRLTGRIPFQWFGWKGEAGRRVDGRLVDRSIEAVRGRSVEDFMNILGESAQMRLQVSGGVFDACRGRAGVGEWLSGASEAVKKADARAVSTILSGGSWLQVRLRLAVTFGACVTDDSYGGGDVELLCTVGAKVVKGRIDCLEVAVDVVMDAPT